MFRILTWNIHGACDAQGNDTTQQITDTIGGSSVDVVALQEVPHQQWASDLARALHMFMFFQETNTTTGLGNLILSPIDASFVFRHQLTKGGGGCWGCRGDPRAAIAAVFPDFTVVNTHLGADPTMYDQYMGAVELNKFARLLPGKVVVVGDFNAHYISPAMWHMRKKGWKDMWRTTQNRVHGYRAGCTFSARFPFQRIDYVLCNAAASACVVATQAKVLNTLDSDHRGVLVELCEI